jgi:hypothetical protein
LIPWLCPDKDSTESFTREIAFTWERVCISTRPQVIFFSTVTSQWSSASFDDTIALAIRNISDAIHADALADGQKVSHAAKYPNYAHFSPPLEIYGWKIERLREIREAIGSEEVMSLAGRLNCTAIETPST